MNPGELAIDAIAVNYNCLIVRNCILKRKLNCQPIANSKPIVDTKGPKRKIGHH